MKQLSLNIAKDTTIANLSGLTPNCIVLAKQTTSTNAKTGEVSTRVRYIEVCTTEKTDAKSIVQSVLRYIVAEFFVCNELEVTFAETNIKQRKLFNQFLNTKHIYRTNAEGKIVSKLESEVPLSQTGLRVNKTHAIVVCKPENRKAAIFQHATACIAQFRYLGLIIDKANELDAEPETTEKTETKAKKAVRKAPSAPGTKATATATAIPA